MRLIGEARERVKGELLLCLKVYGPQRTGQLAILAHQNGKALSCFQVRTLLRETGKVKEDVWMQGVISSTLWIYEEKPISEGRSKNEAGGGVKL